MQTETAPFVSAVQDATRIVHHKAVDMANMLDQMARASRALDQPVHIHPEDCDRLAEMLMALMGTNNTLLQLAAKAELQAREANAFAVERSLVVKRLVGLPLRRLIAWWLRERAKLKLARQA